MSGMTPTGNIGTPMPEKAKELEPPTLMQRQVFALERIADALETWLVWQHNIRIGFFDKGGDPRCAHYPREENK